MIEIIYSLVISKKHFLFYFKKLYSEKVILSKFSITNNNNNSNGENPAS